MTDLLNSATFQNRFNQAQRFIAPTLRQAGLDLSKMRALEIGCGEGAKVCALAPLFETYVGIDLDPHELAVGRANVESRGIQNAELRLQAANDLPQLLAQESFDVIFLYAVIEHLTIEERLNTLKICWDALPPHGLLYIGEAPNRIAPIDYHSSKMPYYNLLPRELAIKLVDRSGHEKWRQRVWAQETTELGLYRNGQHVGFEDFDLGLMPMDQFERHLIVDNWSEAMMNLYPLRWFEPRNLEDFEFFAASGASEYPIPQMFGRYWIEGILAKTPTAKPLPSVRFLQLSGVDQKRIHRDRLGVPIHGVHFNSTARVTVAPEARELSLGISDKSYGRFQLLWGEEVIGDYAVEDIRAANLGIWTLQSWKTVRLPQAAQGQAVEMTIRPTEGSWLGLCPPFTR